MSDAPATPEVPETPTITRSDRDLDDTRERFASWLATTLGPDADAVVDTLEAPSANGMSSETLLVDASWTEHGVRATHRLVARVEPPATAVPVFPSYDLDRQFEVMRLVAEHTDVPVPRTYWLETDPAAIGAPFFVMERIDGQVPPDVMPYDMGSWVTEATPEERALLTRTTIEVIAGIHSIEDAASKFAFLDPDRTSSPLRAHVDHQRGYYDWVRGDLRIPVVEAAFEWLEEHWPADEGDTVLSWGDSRIGNVMYRDCRPVAVLDWEMARLGPREIDLAWAIFLHRFFEDLCTDFGLDGLPDMLRRSDVAAIYESASGHAPRHLDWYLVYAALRHAVVMARVQIRQVHFGEVEPAEDPDQMVMHAPTLRRMLEGTYWSSLPPELR